MHKISSHLTRLLLAALLSASLLLALSCASSRRSSQGPLALDEAWARAKSLFERERYARAQQLLRDIALNYSGSSVIDSVNFLIARTSFELEDYLIAADEFHRMAEQFPSSPLVGAAIYFEARSLYEQAPAYQLDQEFTEKALQGFQRFLEEFPGHALADSGYHYLAQTREKLAHKLFAAARLYTDLREYASAVLYADLVLDNYYDTPYAGPAQFLKARSYYDLKSWERAREELQVYLEKYPQGGERDAARNMLEVANRNAPPVSEGVAAP